MSEPTLLADMRQSGTCPTCKGEIIFRHMIVSEVPGLRIEVKSLGPGRFAVAVKGTPGLEAQVNAPGAIYHTTRLSCLDCGYFEQRSAKDFQESDTWTCAALRRIGRSDLIV